MAGASSRVVEPRAFTVQVFAARMVVDFGAARDCWSWRATVKRLRRDEKTYMVGGDCSVLSTLDCVYDDGGSEMRTRSNP